MSIQARIHSSLLVALVFGMSGRIDAQQYSVYCLPQSQLVLAGVALGADSQRVRAKLGRPLRHVRDSSMDDGGVYPVVHLVYSHLQVDIGRDRVEMLSTSSGVVPLPSGVRVGMDIEEVGRRLRLPNADQYLKGDTLAPIACEAGPHSPDLAGLSLIFAPGRPGASRRLAKVLLTEYGP